MLWPIPIGCRKNKLLNILLFKNYCTYLKSRIHKRREAKAAPGQSQMHQPCLPREFRVLCTSTAPQTVIRELQEKGQPMLEWMPVGDASVAGSGLTYRASMAAYFSVNVFSNIFRILNESCTFKTGNHVNTSNNSWKNHPCFFHKTHFSRIL